MSRPVETVHERGRSALLAGEETIEAPPAPGSQRWGLSVLVRPDADTEDRLATVTAEVADVAGGRHWLTGGRGSSHLTVRGLEPYRTGVTETDPVARGHAAAVGRAARACDPLRFALTGLVLAPGGVLARAEPEDGAAADLRRRLVAELEDGGSFEGGYRGDQWWASLLHYAEPVQHRVALLDWVQARAWLDLGTLRGTSVELVRYEYDGARTVPVPLESFRLGAARAR